LKIIQYNLLFLIENNLWLKYILLNMNNPDNREQAKEINQGNCNNYNLNMEILSSIKTLPNKIISLNNNELIGKEMTNLNCFYDNSNTCSTNISKDSLLNLNLTLNQNSFFSDYLINNSLLKQYLNLSPYLNSFNYLQNYNLIPYINFQNYFYQTLTNNEYNYNNYINSLNLSPLTLFNNNEFLYRQRALKSPEIPKEYLLLNRKRTNEQEKKIKLINMNILDESDKNRKKYQCKHLGCNLRFKTNKLLIYHHLKMLPECKDDTICLLKMINKTKKMMIKIIEGREDSSYDKFSSLYEKAMKEISLIEHIKLYTGYKFKDKI
jgi:hypothetical protein